MVLLHYNVLKVKLLYKFYFTKSTTTIFTGSLGCWSHFDPNTSRLRGLGTGTYTPTGQFSLKDVVYSDAGSYKCIGQSVNNKRKLEIVKTVSVSVKGKASQISTKRLLHTALVMW